MASVVSVNVGSVVNLKTSKGDVTSAIEKHATGGRLLASGINLAGDDQADRKAHGGYDQAVYFYASEDYAWWSEQLGRPLEPGLFGDNLTTRGIDLDGLPIGTRVRAGEALFELSQPRIPCYKLAARLGDPAFVKAFARASRPGSYARIIEPGTLGAGDGLEIESRPEHDLSPREIADIYFFRHADAARFLGPAVTYLSEGWRAWAAERVVT